MKFVRFGQKGAERPGVLDRAGHVRDMSSIIDDIDGGVLASLPDVDPESLPRVEGGVRLGVPVKGIQNFLCVGLNYTDHAREMNMAIPDHPILFQKATTCMAGAEDGIVIPKGRSKVDWEVELGFVVSKEAKHVSEADAMDHIAGFCIVNDVSERDLQIEGGGQWTKGKSCDGFGPVGPWLVTPDELGDVQALDLWLDVNGERMQTGNTKTMIFRVTQLLAYLSSFMTLHAGDVVTTGTPPGVGMGMKPQKFLNAGDIVELGITGLGVQKHKVTQEV